MVISARRKIKCGRTPIHIKFSETENLIMEPVMQGWGRGEKSLHGRGSSPEGLGKEFGM